MRSILLPTLAKAVGIILLLIVARSSLITSFRRHDERYLVGQAKHRKDTKKLITLAQRNRQDLEQLLGSEAARKT